MDISGYTAEQIREIPELAHLYDAVLFLEQNKGKRLFPKKYEASMIDLGEERARKFFKLHPTMPLREAVAAILGSFTSDIPGDVLLKMTQKIIETWEKLSSTIHRKERELETA
jgi:hypothetical protein